MKRVTLHISLTILTVLVGCKSQPPAAQQIYPTDTFISREGKVGDDNFRYRVYLPQNLDKNVKPAMLLYLHGAGNRGDDNESQLNGLADQIDANKDKISFIVVIPQCLPDRFWDEQMLKRANQALDDVKAEFGGDEDRLFVAGFSLGGFGTWSMAAMFPGKFAAIVPMSGRVLPRPNEMKSVSPEIAELAKEPEPYLSFAERVGRVPIWIFHGTADKVVPIDSSRQMIKAILRSGNANVKFSEVEGAGHEPLGFQNPEFFKWLTKQRRNRDEDGST
jgi:predicted peptidase